MRVQVTAIGTALLCCAASIAAQQPRYLPAEIAAGGIAYTANCTGCHGPEGDGVAGVNFSQGRFRRAASDDDLVRIIVRGIPGTPMAPTGMSEPQAGTIAAYLRSMSEGGASAPPGIAAQGRTIVEGKGQCLTCHSIGGNGARSGPALGDIGLLRRTVDLMRSLVDPAADVRPENRMVRLVALDGTTTTARFLNQDTFSIQLIDAAGQLTSIDKARLRDYAVLTTTPMPSSRDKLTPQELADVVSYLSSLRGRP